MGEDGGIPQEANAWGNAQDMPTWGRLQKPVTEEPSELETLTLGFEAEVRRATFHRL